MSIIIPKGQVLIITGDVGVVGTMYWLRSGEQPAYVGTLSTTAQKFGPFLTDEELQVDVTYGTYSYDFLDSEVNAPTESVVTADRTVSRIVSLTQAEYDALTRDPTTLYIITDA